MRSWEEYSTAERDEVLRRLQAKAEQLRRQAETNRKAATFHQARWDGSEPASHYGKQWHRDTAATATRAARIQEREAEGLEALIAYAVQS